MQKSKVNVKRCSMCGLQHDDIEATKLAKIEHISGYEYTHYFMCCGELVYVAFEHNGNVRVDS